MDGIRSFHELSAEQQAYAGGKGRVLAWLFQAGYPVPDGLVIFPAAFSGDALSPEAWTAVQVRLNRMRQGDPGITFAVRSSAVSEDSVRASFAGGFESVLDLATDEAVREAIHTVRRSRHSERVRAYSEAQNLDQAHERAVVVQRLVRADVSGVLFTADPVTGSYARMPGHLVRGLGEPLVSGQTSGQAFALAQPRGRFSGPPELKRFARRLYKLASRLEEALGGPQDMEWAVEGRKLYLLQSRPITTLQGHNPATGEWNDSLTGDYLWSNTNVSEAVPDVMTPSSWSLWQIYHVEANPIKIPGHHLTCGNIGGRPYMNLSLIVSLYRAVGKDIRDELHGEMLGSVPEDLNVPTVPFSAFSVLRHVLPGLIKARRHVSQDRKRMQAFVAETPAWCQRVRQQIERAQTGTELVALWQGELKPYFCQSCWLLRGIMLLFSDAEAKLRRTLTGLVGQAETNLLLTNLAGSAGDLASLGPLRGLSQVARGELSREAYLECYGHRGPHEMELSLPTPDEDPTWLDRQLAEFDGASVDVETLLARQRIEFEGAWLQFQARYPRKATSIRHRLEQVTSAGRMRESIRSEVTRTTRVIRQFALRAGELTELGDRIFFLSLEEMLDLLNGDDRALAYIPARRETHNRYSALPPYPAVISGRFDPFQWAADPNRRSDYFDSHAPMVGAGSETLTGFAGAAGRVEGLVRRLDSAEEGDQLQPGEILVTTTTNVGWTPLFPRVAAIVTDVGAPLSHAAIVARELGIPAVVGCGNATSRLHTGDRVLVDGARGTVEILEEL